MNAPTAELAAAIATKVTGRSPTNVSRFTTGARHYVYEAAFGDGTAVVVRIGSPSAKAEMAGASQLSGLLRPLGVPLPAILGENVAADLPWLVLERLPGTDLGAVIAHLSEEQLERIAARVAQAQAIVGRTASAGRYGYAATPGRAPHEKWPQVLDDNLERSRSRITAAGLFDPALVDAVRSALDLERRRLDRTPPVPFLHDTTTKNVIIARDGGIVDVDDLCFGDSRYPAALTLAVLLAYGGQVSYVAAWLRHAGQQDDATFRLYVVLFLLDLMGEHGHAFNGNERPSDPVARASLQRAFEENLRLVTA